MVCSRRRIACDLADDLPKVARSKHGLVLITSEQLSLGLSGSLVQTGTCLVAAFQYCQLLSRTTLLSITSIKATSLLIRFVCTARYRDATTPTVLPKRKQFAGIYRCSRLEP